MCREDDQDLVQAAMDEAQAEYAEIMTRETG
jgi:hypothetical protein